VLVLVLALVLVKGWTSSRSSYRPARRPYLP